MARPPLRLRLSRCNAISSAVEQRRMKLSQLRKAGHFPTLVSAFAYFDFSFMVWTLLGALGAQIAAPDSLNLSPQQKGFMVAVPILSGAVLRILLSLLAD